MCLRRCFKQILICITVILSLSLAPITWAAITLAPQWELADFVSPAMQNKAWVTDLTSPRGMAIAGNKLYVATGTTLTQIDIPSATTEQSYEAPTGATFLNDVAVDSRGNVYTSDTFTQSIYNLEKGGSSLEVWLNDAQLEKVNGLLAEEGRLVVTTTVGDKGQLKTVNLNTKHISPLSEEFPSSATFLDGIVSDDWLGYYVTDYQSGKLFHVDSDSGTVEELTVAGLLPSTADLAYLPNKRLLIIPIMESNKLFTLNDTQPGVPINLRHAACVPVSPTNIKLYSVPARGLQGNYYGEFTWAPVQLAFTLASTDPYGIDKPSWNYDGDNGPAKWGEVHPKYALCQTGKNQSPIQIDRRRVANFTTSIIEVTPPAPPTFDYKEVPLKILNNGQTLEVEYEPGMGNMMFDGVKYELKRLNFHSPSEHHMRDDSYGLEVQMVHEDDKGNLAVVVILFTALEIIGSTNPDVMPSWEILEQIWQNVPAQPSDEPVLVPNQRINAHAFVLPDYIPGMYYLYTGSLTTPPCSEGVRWILEFPTSFRIVKPELVTQFKEVMGNRDNNRPVQPLNGRLVVEIR